MYKDFLHCGMTCEMAQEQPMKLLEEFEWKEHELKNNEYDTISNSWPDKAAQTGHTYQRCVWKDNFPNCCFK
jgi:hypothetical protein